MAQKLDLAQLRDELVDAFEWNEEDRARAVMSQLAAQPSQARVVLDEMLASEDASVRRAAVFGLGELGDSASVKRLEQQMATEEAREDHDGESVLEVITQVLGRIKDTGARTSLIRRLKRLASGKVPTSGASDAGLRLWRKRHPDLIPLVRSASGTDPRGRLLGFARAASPSGDVAGSADGLGLGHVRVTGAEVERHGDPR